MKLRCLKKTPVIVQELGFKKCLFGDVIDAKDPTYAAKLMEAYPNCFEKYEDVEQPIVEKSAKNYKNKTIKNSTEKEFE